MFEDAMCDTCNIIEQLHGKKLKTKHNFLDTYLKKDFHFVKYHYFIVCVFVCCYLFF